MLCRSVGGNINAHNNSKGNTNNKYSIEPFTGNNNYTGLGVTPEPGLVQPEFMYFVS